jgi:hypothetical protein
MSLGSEPHAEMWATLPDCRIRSASASACDRAASTVCAIDPGACIDRLSRRRERRGTSDHSVRERPTRNGNVDAVFRGKLASAAAAAKKGSSPLQSQSGVGVSILEE